VLSDDNFCVLNLRGEVLSDDTVGSVNTALGFDIKSALWLGN
jgi:hypothetical protein